MSNQRLDSTLRDLRVPEFVEKSRHASLVRSITQHSLSDVGVQVDPHRLPRLAFIYETKGVASFKAQASKSNLASASEARTEFRSAFFCWRALATLSGDEKQPTDCVSAIGLKLLEEELGKSIIPCSLRLAFHLAATGLLAESTAETRLELRSFDLDQTVDHASWRDAVLTDVLAAFVLLVRKGDGWVDIDNALKRISRLRELQKQHEEAYLESTGDVANQTVAAIELVGFYHLAQITTIVGEYLATGKDAATQTSVRIDRHHDRAVDAFEQSKHVPFRDLADLFWIGCKELIRNCIWTHVAGLPDSVRDFARVLTMRGRLNPVIELWPSQQEALRRNFLDTYPKAILIEMPTSAGKTLLAKFAIVQTKALSPSGTIVYVVPTRALVNQVTLELRADFRDLKQSLRVEQTVPAFELDPTEERMLQDPPDILVTTPEKLDLLVRSDHACVASISLVIADEAHNIGAKGRGARLELLLGTLKRDRDSARFLLLSPFLPNDDELLSWLGEGRELPPIQVDWKPSNRIVGSIKTHSLGRNKSHALRFRTLPAADNADVPENIEVELAQLPASVTAIKNLTAEAVRSLKSRGAILVLCAGRGTAATRAADLAKTQPLVASSPLLDAACRYLEAEVGRQTPLVECLKHGVAYHHAGMSHEAKWLVESLMRKNVVTIVCGTTTLAQGVNFPISTVLVETLKKGDDSLTYQDFWNIAGRAGRTLVDTLGLIAFTSKERKDIEVFLKGEATAVSSQLAELIVRADEIGDKFNLLNVQKFPALSPLLQFLAHAMRVSGTTDLADEVEDLLRASLVYHQATKADPADARALITLCRAYIAQMKGRTDILKLADTTGFSTPSVFKLLAEKSNRQGFTDVKEWAPERLFGSDVGPLTARVQAISELPEMVLGQGDGTPFNAELAAKILRDWVAGASLDALARAHYQTKEKDPDKKLQQFTTYLFSKLIAQASWGIGALEGLCLAGQDEAMEEVGHVPSMIFFGVKKKQAVWLRMVGVPRIVADSLADLWVAQKKTEPASHDEIRTWVSALSDSEWLNVLPKNSPLRAGDLRFLWSEFCS